MTSDLFFLKIAAWRKLIFAGATVWAIALLLVARSTSKLREQSGRHSVLSVEARTDEDPRVAALQQENSRLQSELKNVPDLQAAIAQLRNENDEQERKSRALWAGQSNALQAAIEQKQRELAEFGQWSTQWHKAEQEKAAEERLAERAKQGPLDWQNPETRELLSQLALARKRIIEVRKEWTQLGKSEKDQFRPRLEEAQAQWMALNDKLGKDAALYQGFPIANANQDASTVLLMRSLVPDQNGTIVSVFLDGTVNVSKASDGK
jgi:hypothetical protein